MDLDYDCKFEEMKKYIPFLESMIKRLEGTSSASVNPRQAQLDKIKSLRDLLLDKKKRMKMENLLKCEQVLINLYAKVEQKDTLPGVRNASEVISPRRPIPMQNEKSDLNVVRNKLKSIVVIQNETLPEIARANETEVDCASGSKEPALFQRRPNKASVSPSRCSLNKSQEKTPQKSITKRHNYTRVLVSPEPTIRHKPSTEDSTPGKPLFTRRSPPRPSRRYSPSYHKRERKKSTKTELKSKKSKDLNITLKVPEDSLSSLNTKDILSRIIHCKDGDVDIDTLRELRSQILGELKQTGANEDISDLILKSYKKKGKKGKEEVEEGELSDSESEVIESIYGSLVIVDQNKELTTNQACKSTEELDQTRKIQICLVINSDKDKPDVNRYEKVKDADDISDFEMYEEIQDDIEVMQSVTESKDGSSKPKENQKELITSASNEHEVYSDVIIVDDDEKHVKELLSNKSIESNKDSVRSELSEPSTNNCTKNLCKETNASREAIPFKANFYKPLIEPVESNTLSNVDESIKQTEVSNTSLLSDTQTSENPEVIKTVEPEENVLFKIDKTDETTEIPLLNEPSLTNQIVKKDVVSEIDILQALKNEILSENITIPGTESVTPALHQPKITKVANTNEIITKKRISIEKYKKKSVLPSKTPLFDKEAAISPIKDDNLKKQSLKLTEKECERFNFPIKLALDGSSDDEDKDQSCTIDDIYSNLAPKSPDRDALSDVETTPPVIIPVDPVKTTIVNSKADIDMRKLGPILSPSIINSLSTLSNIMSPSVKNDMSQEASVNDTKHEHKNDVMKLQLADPRLRKDLNQSVNKESPNPHAVNLDRTLICSTSVMNFPNMTPTMTPNSRSYELTPHHSFEDDNSVQKHVYAPVFPLNESNDFREKSVTRDGRRSHWDSSENKNRGENRKWEDRIPRSSSIQRDFVPDYQKSRYNDYDKYQHSRFKNRDDYMQNRLDCPSTPVHSFGRYDCPATPTPSFGRLESPMTPLPSFGRADCPSTPSHPFGMSDIPMTPSHPFGMSDIPMTPSHPFGRLDVPENQTSLHRKFGQSGTYKHDSRFNRTSDYSSYIYEDNTERGYSRDSNMQIYNRRNPYKFDVNKRSHNNPDTYRNYGREQSIGRNDKNQSPYEQSSQNREQVQWREPSVGRAISRDYEGDRFYSRERNAGNKATSSRYENKNAVNVKDLGSRRNYQHERNVRHSTPSAQFSRSTTRAPNVGRNSVEMDDNTLSVMSDAGRSFTIDTSVNRTFQEITNFDKTKFDAFDSRKQRAASVGRSLIRESSVGRILTPFSKSNYTPENKNNKFRRARSVGRDVIETKSERSFKDIKADFEAYRLNDKTKQKWENRDIHHERDERSRVKPNETINLYPRSRKDIYENQQDRKPKHNKKQTYSPRKNDRDPRLRRDQHNSAKNNKYKGDISRGDSRNRYNYGIVYSNDNIAKGTILGTGYGVKNYKIPKIKRAIEEKAESDKEKSNTNKAESVESAKQKEPDVCNNEKEGNERDNLKPKTDDDNIGKRLRNNRKSNMGDKKVLKNDNVMKTRKTKRAVIHDSDSEDNLEENETNDKKPLVDDKFTFKDTNSPSRDLENKNENVQDDTLDSSFNIDDMEIFSDNIASEPVIDINDLLANLDNQLDLDTSKAITTSQFTNEFTPEKTSKSITSTETEKQKECNVVETIAEKVDDTKDLNFKNEELSTNTLKGNFINESVLMPKSEQSDSHKPDLNQSTTIPNIISEEIQSTLHGNKKTELDIQNDTLTVSETFNNDNSKINHDAVVSTTEAENEQLNKVEDQSGDQNIDQNINACSTPDSTINTEEKIEAKTYQEGLPDSTNDQHEMNTDISSTHDTVEASTKNAAESSKVQIPPQIESIGSLLSILQDKSKIKKLLSMLEDESPENEKLKKKLEKLSEIVSDDEEEDTKTGSLSNTTNEIKIIEEKTDILDNQTEAVDKTTEKAEVEVNLSETTEEPVATTLNKEKDEFDEIKQSDDENSSLTQQDTKDEIKVDNSNAARKTPVKRRKGARKFKGKSAKKLVSIEQKRVTRSDAASLQTTKPVVKKPSRELKNLQDDIREMFLSDDILNATGIRMCRLAKMVDDKNCAGNDKDAQTKDTEAVVVLEKFKNTQIVEESTVTDKVIRKKPGPKLKPKPFTQDSLDVKNRAGKSTAKYKPGPKSKTKLKQDDTDPYAFESDSVSETNTTKLSEKSLQNSSDSENESLASSKSYGSTDLLIELKKKPKRKRPKWQVGVIKTKSKKKKIEMKQIDSSLNDVTPNPEKNIAIPDFNCFTDKAYCFLKNVSTYSCRLCVYSGDDIVHHYKRNHPHSEIPLSRMNPDTAKEAIEQCETIDFQAISKIPSDKYVCRFCFKEFFKKKVLETFFWHVVSMHTGEYKQLCSECINVTRCPFNLDIPPPPKDAVGQLMGYICGKCNFTQISLENLKTHVIVRHNDEQTEVYAINLAAMTKKSITMLLKRSMQPEQPRVLRSSRSNQSLTEASDDRSDVTEVSEAEPARQRSVRAVGPPAVERRPKIKVQSKLVFETDDISDISESIVKVERPEDSQEETSQLDESFNETSTTTDAIENETEVAEANTSDDILAYPHFKIHFTETGTKEYVCCINGKDNHYKTTLLISMKKHVQTKHSEKWDGYCFVCKVIVTTQGVHHFKECLQHFLDKHIDDFPVLENNVENQTSAPVSDIEPVDTSTAKPLINVRPLSELISKTDVPEESLDTFPIIESVVSLGASVEPPEPSPSYQTSNVIETAPKMCKYEEAQAEVMSKKHQLVLETMLSREKLVQVYKCAGRYCSFTSDSADDSLLHASTHHRVGGESALRCAYCEYDCSANVIDLVMHVFKTHGCCEYVCAHCFYRAVSSQLVGAHVLRTHGKSSATGSVLKSAIATPPVDDSSELLSRQAAVSYYVCKHGNPGSDDICKFRTYIPNKFYEHLQQRHQAALTHPCYMCEHTASNPTDLIQHYKEHGLKLYQCTWCVYGADKEMELLEHASAKHPNKQPQTYIRIITTKPRSSELRVLPLAHLNKYKVPFEDVTPGITNENPVREAERSIELEKLIGHTTLMIESMTTAVAAIEPAISTEPQSSNEVTQEPVISKSSSVPIPQENLPEQATKAVKVDPTVQTPEKDAPQSADVIYCLDSDEEDTKQGIIRLSDDETSSKETAKDGSSSIGQEVKCVKCDKSFNNKQELDSHLPICDAQNKTPPAANCRVPSARLSSARMRSLTNFVCGVCHGTNFESLNAVKKHMKELHFVTKFVVTSNCGASGESVFTVTEAPKKKQALKRKLSTGNHPTPAKTKRYGPQDIYQLPINPILDELVFCSLCEFSTKVRLNMVRHLQMHAEQQPVPQTAPVNPVPHLETNEKHFDKMVNLASSSIVTRAPDKQNRAETAPSVSLLIPPEAASRYPKYVPERQRHTCGAKGCSYISVDEGMLKCHWETLHAGTVDYHCVHCPPYQHLDTSKPLTAGRIIAHLKMHDVRLYACSSCSYYHYKREILEKHLNEVHKGGRVMIVREESNSPSVVSTLPSAAAPTMDLKPWQCGLCKFKSMLRPEVVEHCAKTHNSKMQFKCAHCPYRASTLENVTKHSSTSHSGKGEEIVYFYYREGSIPDDPEGTPLWVRQRQRTGLAEPEVKKEVGDGSKSPPPAPPAPPVSSPAVDLNIVKREVVDPDAGPNAVQSIEDLCKRYGSFCDPNGIKYKCPLCKIVVEDSREAMQSHMYEELQYRKWSCSICYYKAFHKKGLDEHMLTEHRKNQEPIQLPVNINVETWVTKLLEHQMGLIGKNRQKLAQQSIQTATASTSKTQENVAVVGEVARKYSMTELGTAFGDFGVPISMHFCCPKCDIKIKEEARMQNHLESELAKIRWCCSNCSENFQTYHEAQFHCKSVHAGHAARPLEALRDTHMRSAWVAAVIEVQKLSMNYVPVSEPTAESVPSTPDKTSEPDSENSLLVVRYEERVATPELPPVARKRTAPPTPDSDDERLVIDEPAGFDAAKKKSPAADLKSCPYCDFTTKYAGAINNHMLRHYNLKRFRCAYCEYTGTKPQVATHQRSQHPAEPVSVKRTQLPHTPPAAATLPPVAKKYQNAKKKPSEDVPMICLVCEKSFNEAEAGSHVHNHESPQFAKKGDVVVKCGICWALFLDENTVKAHHSASHADAQVNYSFYKLNQDKREVHYCGHCDMRFTYIPDLRVHHSTAHVNLQLSYTTKPYVQASSDDVIVLEDDPVGKRKSTDPVPEPKRVARKSTTKLPSRAVARKSTTKLPFHSDSDSDGEEEYSYYGTRPCLDDLENVTTLLPFYNSRVLFTYEKLSEVMKINPVVLVKDVHK